MLTSSFTTEGSIAGAPAGAAAAGDIVSVAASLKVTPFFRLLRLSAAAARFFSSSSSSSELEPACALSLAAPAVLSATCQSKSVCRASAVIPTSEQSFSLIPISINIRRPPTFVMQFAFKPSRYPLMPSSSSRATSASSLSSAAAAVAAAAVAAAAAAALSLLSAEPDDLGGLSHCASLNFSAATVQSMVSTAPCNSAASNNALPSRNCKGQPSAQ